MGLSRNRAEAALDGCAELGGFRRGALRSFLYALSDDELMAMQIGDSSSNDEIAGYLDREEKIAGDMILGLDPNIHAVKVAGGVTLSHMPFYNQDATSTCTFMQPHAYFIPPSHGHLALPYTLI